MAHLLAAKYAPPTRAQTQAKTAIAFFMVSVPRTFYSTDRDAPFTGRAVRRRAQIKFKQVIVQSKFSRFMRR
jgi:hypothetical protein